MPQISLYVDEKTLEQVSNSAKSENVSISNWVKSKIQKSLSDEWSEEFKSLIGSIKDETFVEQKEIDLSHDCKRETF
jgi:hypothetical protein